jgi:hypothetical protein
MEKIRKLAEQKEKTMTEMVENWIDSLIETDSVSR